MDTAVKERLIGAAVLVVIVVLVVPALLSGPRPPAGPLEPATEDRRVVEIDLTGKDGEREDPGLPAGPEASEADLDEPPPVQAPAAGPGTAAPAVVSDAAGPTEPPPAPRPPPAAAAAGWAVQIAALSKQEAAEKMAADLRKKGYPAFVAERRADVKVLYGVRVGPEADRSAAEAVALRLRQEGFKPAVVPQP